MRQTNEDFLSDLMNFSPYGGLVQVFIMEAIRHYATTVAKTTPKDNPEALINPVTWHGIATDIARKLEERNA